MSRGLVEIIGYIFAGRRKADGHPPAVEMKHPGGGDVASIYARNPHSSILASVLTSQTGPIAGIKRPVAAPSQDNRASTLTKTVGAGDELRKARETLLGSGAMLAGFYDQATAGYIRGLLAMIEAQHCRIAFIGQMNAGKSSLINTFVGSPSLLPTEITPWTTVVTNMYFGIPKQPTGGAVFEFFNQSEWQQLAEGSARVRALTERLMPNLPWEDFYRQVSNMREKAQEKLGPRYSELLGTQHVLPVVTLEVLEKYIAAESPLGDDDGSTAGEYSMITKAAHLYFDIGNFFYPTVVIDTPGINDPFLVRDEITRQNLERANVFVIVVTARQPLSNADIDLLRILRGLRKDNIVIFVNKADELGDGQGHSDAIVDRIRVLLRKEFPGTDIPIVMGSALWAEIAMGDDVEEKRKVAESAGVDAPHAAFDNAAASGFWFSDADYENTRLTDDILMRSHVPDLALAIAEMLRTGPIASGIQYAASVLAAIARSGAARASENAVLAERLAGGGDESLQARVARAAGILAGIEGSIDTMAGDFDTILHKQNAVMLARLSAHVAAHIADARAATPTSGSTTLGGLTVRLRSALELEFLTLFQEALQQVTARSLETEQALRRQVAAAAEALHTVIECPQLPAVKSSPSLAALGEPVATDIGSVMQGQWGAGWLSPTEKADAMRAILTTEFEAIVGRLAQAAEDELHRSCGFMLEQIRMTVLQALRTAIEDQQSLLALAAGSLEAADTMRRRARTERSKADTLGKLAEDLAKAAVTP